MNFSSDVPMLNFYRERVLLITYYPITLDHTLVTNNYLTKDNLNYTL